MRRLIRQLDRLFMDVMGFVQYCHAGLELNARLCWERGIE